MTLSVIILSYNTKDLTLNCLKSLFAATSLATEVIVVDNASSDGSSQAIMAAYPQVTLIQSSVNRGFAAGNNLGLKVARGEFILLLNSDTEVQSGAVDQLVDFAKAHSRAGAVTPRVNLPDGRLDLACHRGLPTPWNAFTYFSGLEKLLPKVSFFSGYHQLASDFSQAHQISATAATALLVCKHAVDQIGLLDEQFFLYGEDLDYCKRLTDAGWQIWFVPHSRVLHLKSASGKQNSGDSTVRRQSINHFYDTMKQFYEKHYRTTYPSWLRHLVYWGIDLKKRIHR